MRYLFDAVEIPLQMLASFKFTATPIAWDYDTLAELDGVFLESMRCIDAFRAATGEHESDFPFSGVLTANDTVYLMHKQSKMEPVLFLLELTAL